LLAAEQADEAMQLAKQSLSIHELEYSSTTKRAHELRRLLFLTQVRGSNLEGAHRTRDLIIDTMFADGDFEGFVTESLWIASEFNRAGARPYAENTLRWVLQSIDANNLVSLRPQVEEAMVEYGMEP
jgi:hypothetical protein